MLIICNDKEKEIIKHACNGKCDGCVFKEIKCPVKCNTVITDREIKQSIGLLTRFINENKRDI